MNDDLENKKVNEIAELYFDKFQIPIYYAESSFRYDDPEELKKVLIECIRTNKTLYELKPNIL